jgi:hypothetical protein
LPLTAASLDEPWSLDPLLSPLPAAASALSPELAEPVCDEPHADITHALDKTASTTTLFLMPTSRSKRSMPIATTQPCAAHRGGPAVGTIRELPYSTGQFPEPVVTARQL